jgi:acyl-coenzyme A synthetase/AMP-(fatty) acid ligase
MIIAEPRLTTPRGVWNFTELMQDPFDLAVQAIPNDHLVLLGERPEEIVSALLCLEGRISRIFLGESDVSDVHTKSKETNWFFFTSGTSGQPKQIPKTLRSIKRPVIRSLIPSATWGFLTDITRMAGVQVVIEALGRGDNLVIPDRDMTLPKKIAFMREFGVTKFSATPSQYRQLLGLLAFSEMPLSQITLGGEIADQKLLNGLRRAFPAAKITHVYATTETGPVFSVSDGKSGFDASQLAKPTNRLVIGQGGELGVEIYDSRDIHWTGDVVELLEGRYQFVGRSSSFINVGGSKVNPFAVEAVILAHPNVQDCMVKARDNVMIGELVEVDIVLIGENDSVIEELRALCRGQLPRHAVPRFFNFVAELPRSHTGKKGG